MAKSRHRTKRIFVPVDSEVLALLDQLAPMMRTSKAQILAGLVNESKPALASLLVAIQAAKGGDNAQAVNVLNAALLDGLDHAVKARLSAFGSEKDD